MLNPIVTSEFCGPQTASTEQKISMPRSLRFVLQSLVFFLMLGLLSSPLAYGQGQNTGSVTGNVTDSQQAIIPSAQVTLTSPERGFSLTAKANAQGEFVFNQVPVGTYSLTVISSGFNNFQATNVVVDANLTAHVNAVMQVGNVTTQVTVEGSGSTVDTSSATVGELIDNKLVQDLPVDGGNVVALAGLLPGVVNVNAPTTFTGERSGPTYSVSGARNTQNLMLLDGSMWNNLFYNTGLNYPPRQGLQEVSVLLNNFKAEYGRNAGSIFNVVTAAGTNQIHGKLWEYYENNDLDANDGVRGNNPHRNSNQFGATMGGPIVKDKLFFFATFQNIRLDQTAIGLADVQSYAQRGLSPGNTPLPCSTTGAFAGQDCASFVADAAAGKANSYLKNPLYDTGKGYVPIVQDAIQTAYNVAGGNGTSPCYTELEQAMSVYGEYLPNAELPSVCFNPVILNVINKYVPLPASTANLASVPTNTYAPYPRSEYDGLFRVDYIRSNHKIDARFYISDNGDLYGKGISSSTGQGLANYEVMENSGLNDFANIGDTWTITPSLLNVFRVGYKRYVNINIPSDPTTLSTLGGELQSLGVPTLPQFNFNIFSAGANSEAYTHIVNEDIEGDDSLTWTHGNHNVQFGASYLRLQYQNVAQFPGVLQFSTTFTGDAFADSLAGLVNQLEVANTENQAGIEHELFLYGQDDWRITPRLTLNLGLRYEIPFIWYQPDGQSDTFIPGYQSKVFPSAPAGLAFVGDHGIPRGLISNDFDGIAPRLGFAYNLNGSGKTVMRGGFGLFFDALNANVIGVGEPFYDRFNYATPNGGASEPLQGLSPVPVAYDPKNPQFVPPFSLYFPDKNFKTPYVMAMNFGFVQTLTKNSTLEIDYIGKLGRHLTMPYDQNPSIYDCSGAYYQASPATYCTGATDTAASYSARSKYQGYDYGGQGLVDFASVANSSYNGLQVLLNQRASRSLTLIATYTYSRSLDMDTNGQNDNNEVPDVFNLKSEYGPSDYNVTHNVTGGWVYYLPKLSRGMAWERAILNDWQFNGTAQARTGLPFSVTVNNDPSLSDEPNQRAAVLPGVNPNLPTNRSKYAKETEYFNTAAFAYPVTGTFSTLSRNKFVGPGYLLVNLTGGRTFPLGFRQGTSLAFRVDAFNAFNITNLANPNSQFSCSTTTAMVPCTSPIAGKFFGEIQSTYGSNAALTTNGRSLQLSLTLNY
jgi:hypothetical protein